jgi:selenocysteine lyase/cysteine desulfurase
MTPFEQLRRSDYARLDDRDEVYLDYTGAGLYGESQVRAHLEMLTRSVLGNPHSGSPSSQATTTLVEGARRAVLRFFNASDHYTAIFTANATGALKHVGESYAFEPGSRLLLTVDNHNSVNGIREMAERRLAIVDYSPVTVPELRLDRPALQARLALADRARPNLLAFPAQSNFSGVKHPLDLVTEAQERGWDVLLDAAAFVPTNPLDLAVVSPQFVALSF